MAKRQPWVNRLLFCFRIKLSISLRSASVASAISFSSAITRHSAIRQSPSACCCVLRDPILSWCGHCAESTLSACATIFNRSAPCRLTVFSVSSGILESSVILAGLWRAISIRMSSFTIQRRGRFCRCASCSRQRHKSLAICNFSLLSFCTPFNRFHNCDMSTSYFAGSLKASKSFSSQLSRRFACSCSCSRSYIASK